MDTEDCVTLRYEDGDCDLGGFHAIREGPDSEIIFMSDGLVSLMKYIKRLFL